ncbi:MAG TPA: hypothetical protein VE133_17555, partial [Candidatus Sulfotelmatobacter sp.]|nr:hypothetical protein [Candidatus Sulfotelmatobacter sp.]
MALSSGAVAQKGSMVDVGVVVPRNVITGEIVSGPMVPNAGILPGSSLCRWHRHSCREFPAASAADLLKRYKVQAGDSTNFVPADGPFSFKVANNVPLRITRSDSLTHLYIWEGRSHIK